MQKPTVIQLCLSPSWGGLEMSSIKMAKMFKKNGYRSLHICQLGSPIYQQLQKEDIEFLATKPREYFSPGVSRKIRKFIQAQQGDVAVYCHRLKNLWLLKPALPKDKKVKVIGFARMFFKNTNKTGWGHRRVYSCIDKMIALSHIQKRYLLKCLPVPEEKYVVIPNGIDLQNFHPGEKDQALRKLWGVAPQEKILGYTSRLDVQKGCEELIQAMQPLSQKYPDLKCVLIGKAKEKDYADKLKLMARNLNLADKVVFTGHQKNMANCLRCFDYYIMPSWEENFGNVILEAFATALPAIGTDSGGTPEIIDHKENGLLCQPKSVEAIVTAVSELIDNPEQAQKYALAARQKAEEVYDLNKVFAQVEAQLYS